MKDQKIRCPYCDTTFEVSVDWIVKNERVFCGTCCKAFPTKLEDDEKKDPSWYGEFYD